MAQPIHVLLQQEKTRNSRRDYVALRRFLVLQSPLQLARVLKAMLDRWRISVGESPKYLRLWLGRRRAETALN